MNFCEKCRRVSEQTSCGNCGNRKLRQVREDDFCFLIEESASYCRSLADSLKQRGIPCVELPCGSGVGTRFAMPLPNRQMFVQFRFLESAKELINDMEKSKTEALRVDLLENADMLFLSQKLQKKLTKKLRAAEVCDVLAYCVELIKTAHRITDEGLITSSVVGGHYLFCFSDHATISINSKTYEIISLTITKTRR